jgi:hypothetical protein
MQRELEKNQNSGFYANLWGCAIRHDESILRLTCSLGKIEGWKPIVCRAAVEELQHLNFNIIEAN